jgi:hypothetical protein
MAHCNRTKLLASSILEIAKRIVKLGISKGLDFVKYN